MTFPVSVTQVDTVSVDFPGRPTSFCFVISWGLNDGMAELRDKLAEIASLLNNSPPPTKKDLKRWDHFCARVNGEWPRDRQVVESQTYKNGTESVNLVEVFSGDFGFQQHLVRLCFYYSVNSLVNQ